MKIKWIGKYDGNNLPTVDVEVGAKELVISDLNNPSARRQSKRNRPDFWR